MNDAAAIQALRHSVSACISFNVACTIVAALALALLLRKLMFRPKIDNIFPVWAMFELALVSYILRGDGIGRRIL